MKRHFAIVCIVIGLAGTACGNDEPVATPSPTATNALTGRIMGPADKAQKTVDQLNQQQQQQENQTGTQNPGYP